MGFVTMSHILPGNNDQEKLSALCTRTHKEQVVWFLNAFWNEHQGEAEKLWAWKHKCDELDLENHENGCGLDELNAHRFLEDFNETMTVRELRENLRKTGAIGEGRLKLVPIAHILIFKFKVDWKELVNRTQGDNREEMEAAQKLLNEVLALFAESEARQKEALAREDDARKQEAPFKAAQEDEYQGKINDCERRSEQGGVVQRNKAKAELAQLKAEDPLPLSRAKITLEAAQKRAEKARAPF